MLLWAIAWSYRGMNLISSSMYVGIKRLALVGAPALGFTFVLVKEFAVVKNIETLVKVSFSYTPDKTAPPPERPKDPPPEPPKPPEPKPPEPARPVVYLLHPKLDCGEGSEQRIEPFGVVDHALGEKARGKLTKLMKELEAKQADNRLVGFVLVGSADKRPLRSKLASSYGSNDGLSQARSRSVKEVLESTFKPDRYPILTVHAGPSKPDHPSQ